MKKYYLLAVLLLVVRLLGAVDLEISTGLGYGIYGITAEKYNVKADSYYHTAGLELGTGLILADNWESRLTIFAGIPFAVDIYLNDQYNNSSNLSSYDDLKYRLGINWGISYRHSFSQFMLSTGPFLIINNVILTTKDPLGSSLYSYTLGGGLLLRGEYFGFKGFGLYGEIKGNLNFSEVLIVHEDFSSSMGFSLALGTVWRL